MDGENRIIRNSEVLEDAFIPGSIVHREGQLRALEACLKPLLKGQNPRDSFIWGRPGTGKTCIARYLTRELGKESGVKIAYVNCWENTSRFRILFGILEALGLSLSVHRKGTPLDEVLGRLRKELGTRRVVVILDEADQLDDGKVIYDLANSPNLCLLLIANQETVMHDLDARTRSRLSSAENIEFPEYSGQEILDILKDRREWGLVPGALNNAQLERLASRAGGDARFAIGMLRVAAQKAESQDLEKIPDSLLDGARPPGRCIEGLNPQQKVIIDMLKEKSMGAALLYQEFLKAGRSGGMKPVVDRMFRKHLESLVKKGMIKSSGYGRWKVYTVA